jgi:cell division protein FtsA
MARERIVVGIDVGTTKVCALIAAVSEDDQLEVIGVGVVPSRGLKKGVVVSVEETVESIEAAVAKAEQQSGFKIVSAYVGIAGAHISSVNSHGVVAVHRHDNVITEDDVNRALEAARVVTIPPDREIVHVLPRHFIIDGQEGIKDPAGMLGHRLEVDTTIVAGSATSLNNMMRCVERVGIGIDDLVLQPLAAGEAVLTDAERELGVVLLDIGGGTTDIAVFCDGSLAYASILPIGGNHISNDIAMGLRTPFAAAEEVKLRHGYALPELIEEDRTIEVAAFERDEGRTVSLRLLGEIIQDRLDETFDLVREQLAKGGYEGGLPAGIVLTGGTAQLRGIRRLAAQRFQGPVRIGVPAGMFGLVDTISGPAFAASAGLLKYGLKQEEDGASQRHTPSPLSGAVGSVLTWLRSFLP